MLHNYADWSKYVQRANTSYKQRDGGGAGLQPSYVFT